MTLSENVSLPRLTACDNVSSVRTLPDSPISPMAIRIEVAPMSITATVLMAGGWRVPAASGVFASMSLLRTFSRKHQTRDQAASHVVREGAQRRSV